MWSRILLYRIEGYLQSDNALAALLSSAGAYAVNKGIEQTRQSLAFGLQHALYLRMDIGETSLKVRLASKL
jgi:hypothetical protein